jgi:hypothetical protein
MCVCLCVLGNSLSLEMIESTEHFFLSDDWQQWALHHYRKDSDLVQQVGRSPAPRYCELHNNRPKTAETSAIRVS